MPEAVAQDSPKRSPLRERITAGAFVFLPPIATVIAIIMAYFDGISWLDAALFLGMYAITMAGIAVGFHRLFSHHSFKCYAPVRLGFAIAGGMAAQGSALYWVAHHRRHHANSDTPGDPHSPRIHGPGIGGALRGFWHAHSGWMLNREAFNMKQVAPDVAKDPLVMWTCRRRLQMVLLGLLIPMVIGGIVTESWEGAWSALLWGGFVRMFAVHQMTWGINSLTHLFGKRPYESGDASTNLMPLAVLNFGDGWHNNHHAFPTSARHGLSWWQLDMGYWLVIALKWVGLAWDVRTPSAEQMERKRKKADGSLSREPVLPETSAAV